MRRILTAALAALTFAGSVAATSASAQSRYYRRHHDNDAGVAIAAGVVGLALGAAIAGSSNNDRYYGGGYYGGGYYGRSYYQPRYRSSYGYYDRPGRHYSRGYGYRTCESRERVFDRYEGRTVVVTTRYAC